jgi:AraC family transcriptional regulator of adaptative response/methylated-DNA-[protein]-cysteine methyltransferase
MRDTGMLASSEFLAVTRALRALDALPDDISVAAATQAARRAAGAARGGSTAFERRFGAWAGVSLAKLALATVHEGSLRAAAHALCLRGAGRLSACVVRVAEIETRPHDLEILWGCAPTPFGDGLFARSPQGIFHVAFCDSIAAAQREFEARLRPWRPRSVTRDDAAARRMAQTIFTGADHGPIGLHLIGSPFRTLVWQALLALDGSETKTYGEMARSIRKASAARAVGGAVGANRIGWLVPCHHVLRNDGSLGGFHWGVDRKRAMLVWESLPPTP